MPEEKTKADNVRRVIDWYCTRMKITLDDFAYTAGADVTYMRSFMLGTDAEMKPNTCARVVDFIGDLAKGELADVQEHSWRWGPDAKLPDTALSVIEWD
jgi:hypothetical protein